MKCIFGFLFLCGFITSSKAVLTQEQMQMMKKVVMECAAKEQATTTDLEELMARKPPSTKTAHCLHACMAETFGVLKDNRLDVEAVVGMANMVLEDAAKVQIIRYIATECAALTDTDRCGAAAKICRCVHDMALAQGLSFDI